MYASQDLMKLKHPKKFEWTNLLDGHQCYLHNEDGGKIRPWRSQQWKTLLQIDIDPITISPTQSLSHKRITIPQLGVNDRFIASNCEDDNITTTTSQLSLQYP